MNLCLNEESRVSKNRFPRCTERPADCWGELACLSSQRCILNVSSWCKAGSSHPPLLFCFDGNSDFGEFFNAGKRQKKINMIDSRMRIFRKVRRIFYGNDLEVFKWQPSNLI
jgi:hypothetical protein